MQQASLQLGPSTWLGCQLPNWKASQCRLQTQAATLAMAPTWARALHTIISFSLPLTEQTAQAVAEAAFAVSIWSLTFSLCVRCKLKNHRASAAAAKAAIEINNRHRCHLVAGSILLPSKLILRQRTEKLFPAGISGSDSGSGCWSVVQLNWGGSITSSDCLEGE